MTLAGQHAVLASLADSLRASVGVSPAVRDEALDALAEAFALHRQLEAALSASRRSRCRSWASGARPDHLSPSSSSWRTCPSIRARDAGLHTFKQLTELHYISRTG